MDLYTIFLKSNGVSHHSESTRTNTCHNPFKLTHQKTVMKRWLSIKKNEQHTNFPKITIKRDQDGRKWKQQKRISRNQKETYASRAKNDTCATFNWQDVGRELQFSMVCGTDEAIETFRKHVHKQRLQCHRLIGDHVGKR